MQGFRSFKRALLFASLIASWAINIAHAQDAEADGQTRTAPSRVTRARFGVMVTGVFPNYPATRLTTEPKQEGDVMKLDQGDVITHVNGEEVRTFQRLRELLAGSRERKLTVMDKDGNTSTLYGKPVNGMLGINVYVLPSRRPAQENSNKKPKPLDEEKGDGESWAVVSITNDTDAAIDIEYRFGKSGSWKSKSIKAGGRSFFFKKLADDEDPVDNRPLFQVSFNENPEGEKSIVKKKLDLSILINVERSEIAFDDGTKYNFGLQGKSKIKLERAEREL